MESEAEVACADPHAIPGDPHAIPGDQSAEPGVVISATALTKGQRAAIRLHAGERDRLRVTANDKPVLTK
ncbi:hemin uptake protein HemP [Methylobacterium planeticum]|uniref:Hemin uptake protein HemP n=1 Tax=Methylobacterium planeticum TaxID=2615211 RepID=A0A6N6MK45_9HYPH|nr:hemin uptake protein HemP [Methylobacterium planeticum]